MKNRFIFISLFTALLFSSCGEKKKAEMHNEYLRPASIEYSKMDTAKINELIDNYINCYKNNDLEAASRMLYKIKNDSIFPLSENERKQYMEALSQFRIYDAKATGFILRSDKNNEMTITLQIIPSPQGDIENGTGVMKFALNPILKDGQWYLTLRDLNAEGVENYYEEHAHD